MKVTLDSIILGYTPLSQSEIELIRTIRKDLYTKSKNTPPEGVLVPYLDKEFIVYPNCFYPFEDSKPLVENFVIHPGEVVLDIGTGSGVIAIFSAYKGAQKVVAVDINPDAIKTATENIRRHKVEGIIDLRLSDGFQAIRENEIFDVITANPPFTNEDPSDMAHRALNDGDLHFHKILFSESSKHLKNSGRIYVSQANFGALSELFTLAEESGFTGTLVGERKMQTDPRIFYAFEFQRV